MRFVLEGGDRERELVVRPARPTRDENRLSRLFASRLEYLDLEVPVRGVRCIGSFSPPVTPQGTLFGSDGDNRLQNARKVLAALQAERGGSAVQYARLKEDPLPVRCFELVDWTDFPEADSRVSIGPKAVGSGGEETAVGEASRSVQSLSPGSAAPEFSAAARRSSAPEGRPVSPASEDPAAETRRRKFPDLPLTRRVVLNPHPLEGPIFAPSPGWTIPAAGGTAPTTAGWPGRRPGDGSAGLAGIRRIRPGSWWDGWD